MRGRILQTLAISLMTAFIFSVGLINKTEDQIIEQEYVINSLAMPIVQVQEVEVLYILEEEPTLEEPQVSDEDIDLLALLVMAEAEGECDEGKRLVVDTVLNRVDSRYFPDTIQDVIYQKNQFSCVNNGRLSNCTVNDDIRQLVIEELTDRSDFDVVFFRTKKYSAYGSPLFVVGNHYFSEYERS